jgi:hypothetical protein
VVEEPGCIVIPARDLRVGTVLVSDFPDGRRLSSVVACELVPAGRTCECRYFTRDDRRCYHCDAPRPAVGLAHVMPEMVKYRAQFGEGWDHLPPWRSGAGYWAPADRPLRVLPNQGEEKV